MNKRWRNALIVAVLVIGLILLAEQAGVIGTDLSYRLVRFITWDS